MRRNQRSASAACHGISRESPKSVHSSQHWTLIPTARVIAGLGVANPIWNKIADENGLLAYTTAVALMAKLASERFGGDCIEFRLLQRKLTYSWNIEDVGTTEPFTFMDRQRTEKITPMSGISPNTGRDNE